MVVNIKQKLFSKISEPVCIYSTVYPLYRVCHFFGLSPYVLEESKNHKRFAYSILSQIKSFVFVLGFVAATAVNIYYKSDSVADAKITFQLRYGQEILSSLLSACEILFCCIFAVKFVNVFQNIFEVDGSFRTLAVWVPYKHTKSNLIIHLWLLAFGSFCTLTLIIYVNYTHYIDEGYTTVLMNICYIFATIYFPYVMNLLMELQYVHYLNILKSRYKLLNEYLLALVHENKTEDWTDITFNAVTKVKPARLTPESTENRKAERSLSKNTTSISDPVYVVDQIVGLHVKLTDTAHLINFAFCFQQLLRITIAFVSIVTALFLIAVHFSKSSGDGENYVDLDYVFTFWAFSNVIEVIVLVWITSDTCEEANACPRILHRIRNNTSNEQLQDTIEIYSLQLYHNRLHFSVCGLFPLDYTLLYTMVAGVTTYLVILIQFNNTDRIQSTNNTDTSFVNSTL